MTPPNSLIKPSLLMRYFHLLIVLTLFYAPSGFASFDIDCDDNLGQLTVALQAEHLLSCNDELAGTDFLNPYNDTRINLMLILEDLKSIPLDIVKAETTDNENIRYEIPFYYKDLFNSQSPPQSDTNEAKPVESIGLTLEQLVTQLGVDKELIKTTGYQEAQCISNDSLAAQLFLTTLNNLSISTEEKQILAKTRLQLLGLCQATPAAALTIPVNTPIAQEMATYLQGINYFYSSDFANAANEFKKLSTSEQAWLKETALYMLARTALNDTQADESFVETQLNQYLTHYPQGAYADSARGLFRRLYWLSNNQAKLAKTLATAINSQPSLYTEQLFEFINEAEHALFFPYTDTENPKPSFLSTSLDWDAPLLYAVAVLVRMRTNAEKPIESIPLAVLQDKQTSFTQAGLGALHTYLLLADTYFVQKDYAAVLQKTTNQTISSPVSMTTFSTLTLRALAFEKTKQWEKAETIWLDLFKNTQHPIQQRQLQLALALNYEQSGRLQSIFAKDSAVTDKRLQHLLIQRSASAKLLEDILNTPDIEALTKAIALKTLLFKQLIHANYAEFTRIYQQYPIKDYPDFKELQNFQWTGEPLATDDDHYTCQPLLKTAQRLAQNKNDAVALNCVGEFFRLFFYYNYAEVYLFYDVNFSAPHGDKPYYLGEMPDYFAGKTYTRLDYSLAVIDNPKAPDQAKAYALYRAINCFATSGANHCGRQEIPQTQRANWFKLLKQKYKETDWAIQQKYYW
ncbi:tetratricopeptide repeat protein [Beggiatoa leptomitoformis]|uniref:Outer membrane assembly lipoprotein YfiO n=1 Tax=Beggiatoa leptomitoformis TaxID=288004 RepID=A0A2N9YHT4_9GAMM|nr:hypothetical protein [Beggiatoa leptomitoformis]ALG67803.2 hypothetical protein AL038_08925 [Beggiatoa leptomitoformis]AUI69945.2 hypothetical protein BLE401_15385 [Beggiatoa leptomitoformis]